MDQFICTKEGHDIPIPEAFYLKVLNVSYSGTSKSSLKVKLEIEGEEKEVVLCTLTENNQQYSCTFVFTGSSLHFEVDGEEPVTVIYMYETFDKKFEEIYDDEDNDGEQMDFKDLVSENDESMQSEEMNDFFGDFEGMEEEDESDEERMIQEMKHHNNQKI